MATKKQNAAATIEETTNLQPLLSGGESKEIATGNIDFSPLNYRKLISTEALEAFAGELAQHGIISPLLVRPKEEGRYELVAGERRLRAARIAGLPSVPVIVKDLTDEQVTEIQLSENLQRENPHPLDEAAAIDLMMKQGKTIEQIAARLGKPKALIFSRMKLLSLSDSFRDMFLAGAIGLKEAVEIALLSEDSQADLYDQNCRNWKKDKHFSFGNFSYQLNRYRRDLNRAPFDTKDVTLVPERGGCSACPFSSAGLKSLFPEMAKEAVCSHASCYSEKATTSLTRQLTAAFEGSKPDALLFNGSPDPFTQSVLATIEGAASLPIYSRYYVRVLQAPDKPDMDEYMDADTAELDSEGYNLALLEYHAAEEEYAELTAPDGGALQGLYINSGKVETLYFQLQSGTEKKGTTAKVVQAAIKEGTATAELLQGEIDRIEEREKRLQEIDREKVQKTIHEQFSKMIEERKTTKPTEADRLAARLLVYEGLDYSARARVNDALFSGKKSGDTLKRLEGLTDSEWAILIRMALVSKPESKYLTSTMAPCLTQVAQAAGLDTNAIQKAQDAKAGERKEKQSARIKDLKKRIGTLKKAA